jgi:hypothetical protein
MPSCEDILKIMKDEDIEGALRADAFILFEHAVRNELEDEIKHLFWQF